jgi:hypothetical protein
MSSIGATNGCAWREKCRDSKSPVLGTNTNVAATQGGYRADFKQVDGNELPRKDGGQIGRAHAGGNSEEARDRMRASSWTRTRWWTIPCVRDRRCKNNKTGRLRDAGAGLGIASRSSVEWRGGIAPPRPPRTGREVLVSSGSYHPAGSRSPRLHRATRLSLRAATRPSRRYARSQCPLKRLHFRIAHFTRALLKKRPTT